MYHFWMSRDMSSIVFSALLNLKPPWTAHMYYMSLEFLQKLVFSLFDYYIPYLRFSDESLIDIDTYIFNDFSLWILSMSPIAQ